MCRSEAKPAPAPSTASRPPRGGVGRHGEREGGAGRQFVETGGRGPDCGKLELLEQAQLARRPEPEVRRVARRDLEAREGLESHRAAGLQVDDRLKDEADGTRP